MGCCEALDHLPANVVTFVACQLEGLNHPTVDGMTMGINLNFTDFRKTWALGLSNSVLNNTTGPVLKSPDATLTLTRRTFLGMRLQGRKLADLVQAGAETFEGDPRAVAAVFANDQTFDQYFNIVTRWSIKAPSHPAPPPTELPARPVLRV